MLSFNRDPEAGCQRHKMCQADYVNVEFPGIQIIGEFNNLLLSSTKLQITDDYRDGRLAEIQLNHFGIDIRS